MQSIGNFYKKRFNRIIMTYNFITISLLLILAYCCSYALNHKNFIKKAVHIRLWNVLILFTFLLSSGAGLVLLGVLEYGLVLSFSHSLLYWHVEFGIAMFWIGIFHIHSYWKPSPGKSGNKSLKEKENGGS